MRVKRQIKKLPNISPPKSLSYYSIVAGLGQVKYGINKYTKLSDASTQCSSDKRSDELNYDVYKSDQWCNSIILCNY